MNISRTTRVLAGLAYIGLTLFLFDTVAGLSRPVRTEARALPSHSPVVVAQVTADQRRKATR